MTTGSVQYAGAPKPNAKRVYYVGSDQLLEGYALCYDNASVVADVGKDSIGVSVIKPATANLGMFAGVVTANTAGRTGPCWCEVYTNTAGTAVPMYTNEAMSAAGATMGIADGTYNIAEAATGLGDAIATIGDVTTTAVTAAATLHYFTGSQLFA